MRELNKRIVSSCLLAAVLTAASLSGCVGSSMPLVAGMGSQSVTRPVVQAIERDAIPLMEAPAMFMLDMPAATGGDVLGNDKAVIDISNRSDGYIMIKFLADSSKKLRVIIAGPSRTSYTYTLSNTGAYEVFPLSDGNGTYSVGIYENVSGNKYSTACFATVDVGLRDEFAPFLRPNQYVNYSSSSSAVKKAAELTRSKNGLLEKLSAIYHYVIENVSYDNELAKRISSKIVTEYIPDVDRVLSSRKGICFDYAALMTAMLRSQGIPCKLVVGYTGNVYHAWINVYSDSAGWLDSAIYFDGRGWKLMDPTYASSANSSQEVMQYIGNNKNYTAKYLY